MSEDLYRRFFEDSSEGLAVINNDGIIEKVNGAFCAIFAYKPDELEGHKMDVLLPDNIRHKHDQHRAHFNANPAKRPMGQNRDLFGRKKNGELIPLEISLSPIKIEGAPNKVAVLLSDISERKDAESQIKELNEQLNKTVDQRTRELQTSQTLYEQISRNFPNGTINVFDKSMNYVFVEGEELQKLGINSKMLRGTNYLNRLPAEIRELMETKLKEVFDGQLVKFEVTLNEDIYQIIGVPLEDESKQISQILMVERNVTEEVRAKKDVENALVKERELNELKSRFVSMASHEFRTPLTTINSSATLISRYETTEQQDKRLKHINKIQNNVQHLSNMLNDILSLSKLEEGKIHTDIIDFDLLEFVKDLVEETELFASGKVKVDYEFKGEKCIKSDPKILKNILSNLMSNAVKYSYDDGTVLLKVEVGNDHINFMVVDHGIGIPKEDQVQIADRFFRASNAGNIEGTGLGLNIVKKYLQALDGELNFTSEPNEQTIFKVSIPAI